MIKVKDRKLLLLPGDGIGPEVVREVKKIIESCIGLTIQVNSPTPFITKNNELDLNIKVIHQTRKKIILKSKIYVFITFTQNKRDIDDSF